jgi:hypothetical protein
MAQSKTKPKSKSKPAPEKGVVGMLKKLVGAKPAAARSETKAKPAKAAVKKSAKTAPAAAVPKGKAAKNGKVAAPPPAVPEPPVKKKPPSITITRPEQTRPPVVILPPKPLEAPIGAPSILLPKGGLPIASLRPDLRWMYVGGATRYEIEMSSDPNFKRAFTTTILSSQTTITLEEESELKPGTVFKWRVRGGNDAGWGPWSSPESFKSPEK